MSPAAAVVSAMGMSGNRGKPSTKAATGGVLAHPVAALVAAVMGKGGKGEPYAGLVGRRLINAGGELQRTTRCAGRRQWNDTP